MSPPRLLPVSVGQATISQHSLHLHAVGVKEQATPLTGDSGSDLVEVHKEIVAPGVCLQLHTEPTQDQEQVAQIFSCST